MIKISAPYNARTIRICPSLTPYQQDLLVDAFDRWIKFKVIGASLGKNKSTVSEQITKAVRLYDKWALGVGKDIVAEMMLKAEQQESLDPSEREGTPKDKALEVLKLQVDELQRQNDELARQEELDAEIKQETERIEGLKEIKLMHEATQDSEAYIEFALQYAIPNNDILEDDIKEYSPEKNVGRFAKRILKDKKLSMKEVKRVRDLDEDEDNPLSDVGAAHDIILSILYTEIDKLEKEAEDLKRKSLLKKYNGTPVTPYCPRKDEGVKCQIILEYDPNHLGDLYCPKHNNCTPYYCPICQGMDRKEVKLEWNNVDRRLVCPVCGCYRPVDFELMEVGMTKKFRDVALEKVKEHDCDETEANEYADKVAYLKWDDRHKEPMAVPLPHEEPDPTTLPSNISKFIHDCPECGEKIVHIGKNLFSCPKCPLPVGMCCPKCDDKPPLKYGVKNNILFCAKCDYMTQLQDKNNVAPTSIVVDGVRIPFRFTNPPPT